MAQLDGKQLRNQSTSVDKLSGTGIVTFTAATVSFGTGAKITTLDANISSGTDVVNKNYVDSVAAGLDPKQPVQVVALSPITLSGTGSVVDGWTLSVGNRVLVNGQAGLSATATNGIYVVSGGAWSRATDSDGTPSSEISTGNFVFVHEGTNYAHSGWVLTNTNASNPSGILAGTDSQLWVQFSEQTNILAGDGLSYTGQNLNVNVGSGITISSDAVVVDYNKVGQVMGGAGLTVSGNTLDVQTTNGLSIVSDAVALGGTLTQDTTISGTHSFSIINGANLIMNTSQSVFGMNSAAQFMLRFFDGPQTITNNGSNNHMIVRDDSGKGLVYEGDFSGSFTPESLVSKRYVDSIAGAAGDISGVTAGAGLSGGGTQGFVTLDVNTSNGLSIVSDAVVLGGTLLKDTSISVSTYTFSVAGRGNLLFDRRAGASESHILNLDGSISEFGWYSDIDTKNNGQVLIVTTTQSIFRDSQFSKGLQYDGDYTANFTENSLVTKAYVDNLSGGLTAQNGLTETSPGVVELGGTLIQNTTIYADSYDFNITNASTLLSDGATVSIHGQKEASMYSGNWGASASYFTLRPDVLIVEVDDGFGGGAQLWVESPNVQVPYAVSDGASASMKIVDDFYQKGLVYVADYTANFTENSLVTKQYVDNKVGLTSGTPVYSQRNLTPVVTSGNGASSSLTLTSTPKDSTNISVYVNGSLQYLGNGVTTGDCYFGTQSGTAVAITSLISGYTLFWNGTNAGFDLSTTDRVDIVYNS